MIIQSDKINFHVENVIKIYQKEILHQQDLKKKIVISSICYHTKHATLLQTKLNNGGFMYMVCFVPCCQSNVFLHESKNKKKR